MATLDEQIEFMNLQYEASRQLWIDGYTDFQEVNLFEAVVKTLEEFKCNTNALHLKKKQCPACGKKFTPVNQLKQCCNDKYRVKLHRIRNSLKVFNQKVSEILKAKDPDAKFTVEQILTEKGKCPFVVNYNGKEYRADHTRSLLTQLKKL